MGIICDISIVAIISWDKPSQIQDLVNNWWNIIIKTYQNPDTKSETHK